MGFQIKYDDQIFSINPKNATFNVRTSTDDITVVPIVDLSKYLLIKNIIAGSNIVLNYTTTGVTVNSTGGGGTLTGATNGLSVHGKKVTLGGTLTGDTTIDGNNKLITIQNHGGLELIDNNGGGTFLTDSGGGGIYITSTGGDIAIGNNNHNGGVDLTDRDNVYMAKYSNAGVFQMQITMVNDQTIFQDYRTGTTAVGIEYQSDLSANFKKYSLVDKNYVTGLTTSINVTANNGLTKYGSNIHLGGALTGDTVIDLNSGVLTIDGSTSSLSSFSVGDLVYIDGGFQFDTDFGKGFTVNYGAGGAVFDGSSGFVVSTTNAGSIALGVNSLFQLSLDKVNGAKFSDSRTGSTAIGITYGGNYSSNFKKYSLVDKNYVTGITGTLLLTSAFNTYSGATGSRLSSVETKYITGATNLGTGNGLFTSVSNHKTQFKSLVAGANISITPSSTGLTISATGSGTVTGATNIGTGSGIFKQLTANSLQLKSIGAGTNISISTGDTLTISSSATSFAQALSISYLS